MTFPTYRLRRALIGLLGVVLAACSALPQGSIQTPPIATAPTGEPSPTAPGYVLAVGDEVELRFADRPDMIHTLRVQPDGQVSPPYLPPQPAVGRTVAEVAQGVRAELAKLADGGAPAQYLLSYGDDLEIRFVNYRNLNQIVRIRPDGFISLTYVKAIAAAGKTPEALENELTARYKEYLRHPELTLSVRGYSSNNVRVGSRLLPAGLLASDPVVSLRSFASPQVFVGGEVVRPGVIAFRSNMTVMQALVEVGGYKPSGELRNVIILRKSGASGVLMRRNLLTDLTEGTTNDMILAPSDVIVLPKTTISSVAEVVDQYVYQLFAPLKNSSFGFVYNLTPDSTTYVK